MLNKIVRNQEITSNMEIAIKERQFEVWFQPQYNHTNGKLVGAEALVRWRHPEKGLIPPGDFIPLFEQNGFIYELDKYVWRETCRYLRKWMDETGDTLPVSVNVSRYDIYREDLVDVISGLVKEYNIPIELLRLEVTESAFAKNTNLIVNIVKKLVDLGYTIEIDDFGSGYSSLNTLRSVPAQVIKLDMKFLDENDDNERSGNIIESVIRMTKWLGMSVIAEGVETKNQGDFLKSIGCSYVQGYLYARPMPAKDYEEHLKTSIKENKLLTLETVENLNNDMFWNPNSIDTLIFNSYVGAACVYEYHKGEIEVLRVTDKFVSILTDGNMNTDEFMNINMMDYIDKKTFEEEIKKIELSIKNKNEINCEFLFIDFPKCSHEVFLKSSLRVIANSDDRYLIYALGENITSQRLLERKEKNLLKQLSMVLDNINCGITASIIEKDYGHFLFANYQYYNMLGYTREEYEEIIGDNIFDIIYVDDLNYTKEIVYNVIRTSVPTTMEYRIVHKNKNIKWIRSYLSMTTLDDNTKVQLCTFSDITFERNRAQDLLDNLPCGAGVCIGSGENIHMAYLNKKYYTYFSTNSGLHRSESIFDVIHPDDVEKLKTAMKPAREEGKEGSCIVRILDKPGVYIPFRLTGVAVKAKENDLTNAIYVTFVPIKQEELSFSEMLPVVLEKMMESAKELSFIKNKNLKYICCSKLFAEMVGLDN